MAKRNGVARMSEIYQDIEEHLSGSRLSDQNRASLRELVNRYAVSKGCIYRYDPKNPGWRITSEGRRLIETEAPAIPIAPVHIETKDFTKEEIDQVINTDRLRIGIVGTDSETITARRRIGQQRLRELTLFNYSSTCAVCDVNAPSLLVASHIIGWAENPEARGILSNLICLCRFHDPLFEQGYWSLTDDFSVLIRSFDTSRTIALLLDTSIQFRIPLHHSPNSSFLRSHRLRYCFDVKKL